MNFEDFIGLLGAELPKDIEELEELLSLVKGEVKLLQGDEIHVEVQDTNRPDLWCVEGLVRALRGFLDIDKGLRNYVVEGSSKIEVSVDPQLRGIRSYIACAVVRDVHLSDAAIRQTMRLQDKLDQTYGRQRRRTSIGLYDFDLITPPLHYGVAKPQEIRFIPLGSNESMTLEEILERHPKGVEYGHIVRPYSVWPIFTDSEDRVLSFPPIINSNDLGKITEETRNILIEVTGTRYETVLNTLNIVTLSMADRGGSIYSAKIHYPYGTVREVVTPHLETEVMNIDVSYIRKVLGIDLNPKELKGLLEKSRFGIVDITENMLVVKVPCYRTDIMHPIDVIEDLALAYGYEKMPAKWPRLPTTGGVSPEGKIRNIIREITVGLGFQEIVSFTMTNAGNLYSKMNLNPEAVVEVANPKIKTFNCLRTWLLPSLMEFLSHNVHEEYPQRIFEVGYCVGFDQESESKTRDAEKLACVTIHSNANFTEAKAMLDALLSNLRVKYELAEATHESFIEGRVGEIIVDKKAVGLIGEIHPLVLENWKLENPASAFEVALDTLYEILIT